MLKINQFVSNSDVFLDKIILFTTSPMLGWKTLVKYVQISSLITFNISDFKVVQDTCNGHLKRYKATKIRLNVLSIYKQ